MKLHELLSALALARSQGAEDNAEVSFHVQTGEHYLGDPRQDQIIVDQPCQAVDFVHNERPEIVLS